MKYENLTEKSLIKKSQKGNTKAFEELMTRTEVYLHNWIFRKTKNESEAEEFLHVTYIKCWKNIKKFRGTSGFKTWACSISRNLFIDAWRKKAKNREQSLEESSDWVFRHASTPHEGVKKLNSDDLRASLFLVLDKLPKIHKDVLYSSAIEELSYKEISKKLGCSIGTVMSRLYYARKKAKQLIINHKDFVDSVQKTNGRLER